MAPWPLQSSEPKAPDKKSDNFVDCDSVDFQKVDINTEALSVSAVESMLIKTPEEVDADKEPCVADLGEDALKDLLDEAISYKNPKDVLGKSRLFKKLLHSVEADKKYPDSISSLRGRPGKPTAKKTRRRQQNRKEVNASEKSSESVGQDFFQAFGSIEATTFSKSRGKIRPKCESSTVFTTLPDGGLQSNFINDEVSLEDCSLLKCAETDDAEISSQNRRIKNEIYAYRCKCTIQVSSEHSANFLEKSNSCSINGVEQTQVQLSTTYNSVKSLVGGGDLKNVGRSSGEGSTIIYPIQNFSVLSIPPLQSHAPDSNGSTRTKDIPVESKKTIDENGNSLSSKADNANDRKGKKSRQKQLKNDKNTIMSQNIEGHRSDIAMSDIDSVMKYIESPSGLDIGKMSNNTRQNTLGFTKQGRVSNKITRPVRDKSSETVTRKSKRVKENKIHKYNSLEELSTTKMEDLTDKSIDNSESFFNKHGTTVDDIKLKTDSTWELSNPYMHLSGDSETEKNILIVKRDTKCEHEIQADPEFHIVTKKQRKKKKSVIRGGGINIKETCPSSYYGSERGFHSHDPVRRESLYRYSGHNDPQRRKSASSVPPSDKSADSSDLDSVHSLPVSSSTQKTLPTKKSTSSGSTPQASYADITRTVSSPPHGNNLMINKSLNLGFLPACQNEDQNFKTRTLSPENPSVPTVVVSLPLKNNKTNDMKENRDKDYPPLDASNEKKKSSDMFVEFTVYIPKPGSPRPCDILNVEETVIVKSPNEKTSATASESLSFVLEDTGSVPCKRPPVILMNEDIVDSSAVTELVFGFEVNQQLLFGSEKKDDIENTNEPTISPENESVVRDENQTQNCILSDVQERFERDKISVSFNHDNIIDFISGEWNCVMNELAEEESRGKIIYFDTL